MTIYSKVTGPQSLRSKFVNIALSLSAKIAMLEGGPGSISSLGQLWRLVTLYSFSLQVFIVLHLKDPISYLFGARRSRSLQNFKDNWCPLEQPLLHFIKRQKKSFFEIRCKSYFSRCCSRVRHFSMPRPVPLKKCHFW